MRLKMARNVRLTYSSILCLNSVKISRLFFDVTAYFRNKPERALRSGWPGPGRFIVLNGSISLKMVIEIYFNCFKGYRAVWMSSRLPM